jgi:hypothetical protein
MRAAVDDTGVLIAADRNDRRVWAAHRVRLEAGVPPVVPAAVLAQASRSSRQAQMRRLLRGCEIAVLNEDLAHRAGALLGRSRTRDVVDASLVAVAVQRAAEIVSDDADDLRRLIAAAATRTAVHPL